MRIDDDRLPHRPHRPAEGGAGSRVRASGARGCAPSLLCPGAYPDCAIRRSPSSGRASARADRTRRCRRPPGQTRRRPAQDLPGRRQRRP
ncbi:hypothetical protein [Ornithinimicrobium kibberense]|uniref:hypothetical protein n=1 Tax=Ornithinimicrobium kibberense TaxID=282060 RepID=UPI003618055E